MTTATLKRRAEKQTKRVRSGVEEVGHAARSRAGDLRKVARSRAGDLRKDVDSRTKDTRRRLGYWIAGEEPARHRVRWAVLAGAAGATAAFFLDPVSGKRRRHVARDWVAARLRRVGRRAGRAGRAAGGQAYGAWQAARHRQEAGPPENDQVLAHKVESEALAGPAVDGASVLVNAEEGVVALRGVVRDAGQIREIEDRVRRVHGVRGVDNQLHVQGTPAPTS
jgi:BON domain-containing protein